MCVMATISSWFENIHYEYECYNNECILIITLRDWEKCNNDLIYVTIEHATCDIFNIYELVNLSTFTYATRMFDSLRSPKCQL